MMVYLSRAAPCFGHLSQKGPVIFRSTLNVRMKMQLDLVTWWHGFVSLKSVLAQFMLMKDPYTYHVISTDEGICVQVFGIDENDNVKPEMMKDDCTTVEISIDDFVRIVDAGIQ